MTRTRPSQGGGYQIEAFLEMMSAERGAAANTLAAYRRDLDDYAGYLGRNGSGLERAGPEQIRRYLGDLDARGMSAPTVARRLSAIRQFHRFLYGEGSRADDPTGSAWSAVNRASGTHPTPKRWSWAESTTRTGWPVTTAWP